MPNRSASLLIALALAFVASAAVAQTAPAQRAPAAGSTVGPVTVQAAPPAKVVRQQSYDFVLGHAATANPEVDQIARWRDPVCVQVEGLPTAQAALIKARIEDVAKAVGLHAARPSCKANVEVVFSDRPQAVMDKVAREREYLLGYAHRHERDKLKQVTRPIQAWYVSATLGGGGDSAQLALWPPRCFAPGACPWDPMLNGIQMEREVIDDPEIDQPISCGDNPAFSSCLQSELKNVFMVADRKALGGQDVGLLADYLAVLALSQPKSLDGCGALQSVLDVLAPAPCPGREPPDGLTPGDAAYLTALYKANPEHKKASDQTDIAARMAKILVKANAAAK